MVFNRFFRWVKVGRLGANALESQKLAVWAGDFEFIRVV